MLHSLRIVVALLASFLTLTVLLTSCGGAATRVAPYTFELSSEPIQPRSGQAATVKARITDQAGNPVNGAKVTMQREHLDAAHERPTSDATEAEPGVYATRVNFSMSGRWKVTVGAEGPEGRAQRDFELQVQ